MPAHLLANAKAYCALIGAICTGLLGVYGPETPVGQVLVVILAVCTAVATFAVPNKPRTRTTTRRVPTERGQVDAAYLLKVIVLVLVAVLIVAVLFGAVPLPIG